MDVVGELVFVVGRVFLITITFFAMHLVGIYFPALSALENRRAHVLLFRALFHFFECGADHSVFKCELGANVCVDHESLLPPGRLRCLASLRGGKALVPNQRVGILASIHLVHSSVKYIVGRVRFVLGPPTCLALPTERRRALLGISRAFELVRLFLTLVHANRVLVTFVELGHERNLVLIRHLRVHFLDWHEL